VSRAWSPPRRADELPDDDHDAAYRLTGGLYDGVEIGRRERKLWPPRRCPPFVRNDPEMTERFKEAVMQHDELLKEIQEKVDAGEIDLASVSDADIVGGLRLLSLDRRRPSVQLQALKTLAEMRGLIKNSDTGGQVSDDELERILQEAELERSERRDAGELRPKLAEDTA
jgi:hypothetical protein